MPNCAKSLDYSKPLTDSEVKFVKSIRPIIILFSLVFLAVNVRADAVSDWHALVHTSGAADGRAPTQSTRIAAMTQIAIHDALNAINSRYERYAYYASGNANAAAVAAIAAAGYNVLRYENPTTEFTTQLTLYNAQLASVPDGPDKEAGIAIGIAAAGAVRSLRANDGLNTACAPYMAGSAPGEWRPLAGQSFTTPCWGANVAPFTMVSSDRWRPAPRPYFVLTSTKYAREFDEVKRFGSGTSTERTVDQSEAARFWYPNPPLTWSRFAADAAADHGFDLWESARLFALLSVSPADALIAVWDSKRAYPFWRPVAAIREADTDGNPATEPDTEWSSYLGTPPYPDYISGHSGLDGAAAEVFVRVFGTDEADFTSTTTLPPFGSTTRSFASFSGAAKDGAESRIWAGIHFRPACEDALQMGQRVSRQAVNHYLRPLDEF